MAVAGFSINMLTLFALVLVIGTVVDDSIVVVEAVQARFDAGYRSAYKASVDAMNGLTSALFTTTLVFMVIFIPVSFVSGTSGTFYKQFGLTMAVAVGISLLYALTLAPALCTMILKFRDDSKRSLSQQVRRVYNASFHALLGRYTKVAMLPIRKKWLAAAGVVAAMAMTAVLLRTLQERFKPVEFAESDDPLIVEEMKKIEVYRAAKE